MGEPRTGQDTGQTPPAPPGPGAAPPKRGLTLFEIIVIVLLLAAAALAGAYLSRQNEREGMTARESSVFSTLHDLVTAQEQYKSTSGSAVYGTFSQLSATRVPYIPPELARDLIRGRRNGYSYVMTLGTPADTNYTIVAYPIRWGRTGRLSLFVDNSGTIRVAAKGIASSADSCID